MTPATPAADLFPVRSTNRALARAPSDLGFASIALSVLTWPLVTTPDAALGAQSGIFVGPWAPTSFALSGRLGRYGEAGLAEASGLRGRPATFGPIGARDRRA